MRTESTRFIIAINALLGVANLVLFFADNGAMFGGIAILNLGTAAYIFFNSNQEVEETDNKEED